MWSLINVSNNLGRKDQQLLVSLLKGRKDQQLLVSLLKGRKDQQLLVSLLKDRQSWVSKIASKWQQVELNHRPFDR